MKNFKLYLTLQLKRIRNLFPSFFIISVSVFLLTGICFLLLSHNSNRSSGQKKFIIGVTGETGFNAPEVAFMNLGITAIQLMDYSSSYIELKTIPEDQAASMLKNGEILAYIHIPQGFIESVNYGWNDRQITFVTNSGGNDVSAIIKDEVSDIITRYVTHTQSSIFTMQRIIRSSDKWHEMNRLLTDMNKKYLNYVIHRNDFSEVEITDLLEKNSITSTYFCAFLVFFLLISGMNCVPFFSRRNLQMEQILNAKGTKALVQVSCELVSYLAFIFVFTTLTFILLFVFFKTGFIHLPEWKSGFTGELSLFYLKTFLVMLLSASFHFFIFEAISSTVSQIGFLFITGFGLCFISGCFYPIEFFPQFIQQLSKFLPSGSSLLFLQKSIIHKDAFLPAMITVLWIILFVSASILLRRKKLNAL